MEGDTIARLIAKMVEYETGSPGRVQHFLKVYGFAQAIGRAEKLDERTQAVLEVSAVVHDIGIKPSLEKYGSSAGNYQELEGPGPAAQILDGLGLDEDFAARVCYLIGHHHTYQKINGMDYQILIEADFLVNIFEGELKEEQIRSVMEKYFRTKTGKQFLCSMYLSHGKKEAF